MAIKRNESGAFIVTVEFTWVELMLLSILLKRAKLDGTGELIDKLDKALQEVQKGDYE